MKKIFYLSLLLTLFAAKIHAQTTQKCNCTGCKMTIDSVVNTPVTVPSNSKLCIGPNGVLNGVLNMGSSSQVCNSGNIKGNIYMGRNSTICNDGSIEIDSMHQDLFVGITNYGNIIVKKDIKPLKTEYIKNHGCMTFQGNVQSEGFGSPVWGGKMFIDGNWHMLSNSSETVIIDGYVQVRDTLIIDGTSKLAINEGKCLKAGYINLKKGYIDGRGPGFSRIEILKGSGPATGGTYTGMLDVCITVSPGSKPVAKSIDPTVTFCSHPEITCNFSRCDSVTSGGCLVSLTEVMSHPYCKSQPYGSITVTPSGGTAPYTYSWSGGQTTSTVTGLRSGSYTVTLTDGAGCKKSKTYMINPAAISPLLVQSNDTLYAYPKQSGNINLYRWFLNGTLIQGANLDYFVVTQPGTYAVNVTTDLSSENSCTGVSNTINVHSVSIMPVSENSFSVQVIPNPNNGIFSIHISAEKATGMNIELYDIMGRQVFSTEKTIHLSDRMNIDISAYSGGLYFLDIKDKKGNRSVTRIVSY